MRVTITAALTWGLAFFSAIVANAQSRPINRLDLENGWAVQSSDRVTSDGGALSTPGFAITSWFPTKLPATVLAAQMQSGLYADAFYGMNFRSIPGTTYPIGDDFGLLPIPSDSPYAKSWWYRDEFLVPSEWSGQHFRLRFGGINYSANLWVNGKLVASRGDLVGTYRHPEVDLSSLLRPGELNAVAVEIFPPEVTDLSATWVDWNPAPADKNMGLWREVALIKNGPVAVKNTQVVTHLKPGNIAELTVYADLENQSGADVTGTLEVKSENLGLTLHVPFGLKAGETQVLELSPGDYPALRLANPKLWWPYQMGEPTLQQLTAEALVDGQSSDLAQVRFGIREVTSELTPSGSRLFRINGKKLMVRGGGWASDLFLRFDRNHLAKELSLVKDLGLNTIRMEGRFEPEYFLEQTDELGILVMPGWVCCSHWEESENWKARDFELAGLSLSDQLRELRNHPSILAWLYGSDSSPSEEAEQVYLKSIAETRWPNPALAAASDQETAIGKTGVKMTGPYDYVPPSYWTTDTKNGGGWGFNTETSPGPAVPELASLQKFLAPSDQWPIGSAWNFHAGSDHFQNMNVFLEGLTRRYGAPTDLGDLERKSQVMAYDGHRAMFEAYSKNKYKTSTGVVQWMLNNAWPSMIWHLFDYYLRPDGSYFGAKKANEPVHAQYSYNDQSIWVVNQTQNTLAGLSLRTRVLDFNLHPLFDRTTAVNLASDASQQALSLPAIQGLGTTYFLKLELNGADGKSLSQNFYWLSSVSEVMDWANTDFTHTPTLKEGDLKALAALPSVQLTGSARSEIADQSTGVSHVVLTNPSPALAFFVRLSLVGDKTQDEVLPAYWSDNDVSLLPGETRKLDVRYPLSDLKGESPLVKAEGWNVPEQAL